MLKARVLDPVKLVLRIDPAIDHEKSNYEKYAEHYDMQHLVFKTGETPSIFTINQLKHGQRNKIYSVDDMMTKASMAVRCGLVDVENYWVIRSDGSQHQVESPKRAQYGEWGNIITEEWMESSHLLTDELIAIGGSIIQISEARAPLS